MKRRNFLKVVGAAGAAGAACAAGSTTGVKAAEPRDDTEFVGVLVDTTRCIGCRACEKACSEEHQIDFFFNSDSEKGMEIMYSHHDIDPDDSRGFFFRHFDFFS